MTWLYEVGYFYSVMSVVFGSALAIAYFLMGKS